MTCPARARRGRLRAVRAPHQVASAYADSFGRGAFLSEEAADVLGEAQQLLAPAVVADRLLERPGRTRRHPRLTKRSADERSAAAEREFREALLFPQGMKRASVRYDATVLVDVLLRSARPGDIGEILEVSTRRDGGHARSAPVEQERAIADSPSLTSA